MGQCGCRGEEWTIIAKLYRTIKKTARRRALCTILHKKNAERRSSLVTVSGDVQTTRFGHMAQKLVESAAVLTGDDRRPLVLSDSDIFRECTRQTKKIGRKCNGRRRGIWPGRVQDSQSRKIDAAMPFVCAWKIWRSM